MLASFGGATFEPPAKAPPPRTGIDLFSPVTDAPRKGRRVFERQEAMKEHNYLAHVDGSNPADWGKPPAASSADGTHSSKFGIGCVGDRFTKHNAVVPLATLGLCGDRAW